MKSFTVLTPEKVRMYVDTTIGPDETLRLAFSTTHRQEEIAYLTSADALALRDFLIEVCVHFPMEARS